MGVAALGRIWRARIFHSRCPIQRAALTYCFSRSVSTDERTVRAKMGMRTMAMAVITVTSPGLKTATNAMASRMAGKA